MISGKSYFVCGLPYQLAIKESLLMKDQVLDEMSEDDFDATAFPWRWNAYFWRIGKAFLNLKI